MWASVGLGRIGTSSYCSKGDVLDLFLFQANLLGGDDTLNCQVLSKNGKRNFFKLPCASVLYLAVC